MRGKRAKQYRKQMQQFSLTFGFREPYQVLLDSQMVIDATRFAMDLPTSLSRTLSATVKPLITQCSIRHLYTLDSATHPNKETLIATAKNMERRRCGHHELETPLSDFECMKSVIDPKSVRQDTDLVNRFNYVVAAQDEEIRAWCRRVRGTPIVYVKRSVMIMERMSDGSVRVRDGDERGKLRAGIKKFGINGVVGKRKERDSDAGEVGAAQGVGGENVERSKKRKRGPKEPNPLSVKKAKVKVSEKGGNESQRPLSREVEDDTAVGVELNGVAVAAEGVSAEKGGEKSTKRRKRKHKSKSQVGSQPGESVAHDIEG